MTALIAALVFNDGWIGYTGSPKLIGAHPSVRMVSEKILVTIHRWNATVDCRFKFKNEASACAVRMGFPDGNGNTETGDATKTIYNRFRSYVDGNVVKTVLLPKVVGAGADPSAFQVKTVRFGAGQMRSVREMYDVPLGSLQVVGTGTHIAAVKAFAYMFSTGASWKGNIGHTEMLVAFAADATMPEGRIRAMPPVDEKDFTEEFWTKNRSAVTVSTELTFTARGRHLYLTKKNWRPSKDDDVQLIFGLHRRA